MSDTLKSAAPLRGSRLKMLWAAILSLLFAGLGQVYAGSWRLGIALLLVAEALSLAFRTVTLATAPTPGALGLISALVMLNLVLNVGAAIDAARRVRHRPALGQPRWFRTTWLVGATYVALGFVTDAALPFGWRSFSIPSSSMAPTLLVGDRLIADIRPSLGLTRGDVILFDGPHDPATIFIKRLIGLPGDRIGLQNGLLIVNGTPIPRKAVGPFAIQDSITTMKGERFHETLPAGRSYATLKLTNTGLANNMPEMTVPPGTVFVMGDNRDNSVDSRFSTFGAVLARSIIGRAGTIFWSPERGRIFKGVD